MFYQSVGGGLYQSNWSIKKTRHEEPFGCIFSVVLDAAFQWICCENCHPVGDSYLTTSTTARLGCVLSDATSRGLKQQGMRGDVTFVCIQ